MPRLIADQLQEDEAQFASIEHAASLATSARTAHRAAKGSATAMAHGEHGLAEGMEGIAAFFAAVMAMSHDAFLRSCNCI
jgi:hypothetical protein